VKQRVFIGSSKEGLQIAYTIQEELEFDAEITVWKQDVFRPGMIIIESLQSALVQFEFAVFVMSPDDQVVSRSRERLSPRDNVIFELGLFIGRLGRDRVFFIVPQGPNELKLPTDLLGITSLTFDNARTDGNLRAALGPACNQLRRIFEAASQPKVALGLEAWYVTPLLNRSRRCWLRRLSINSGKGLEAISLLLAFAPVRQRGYTTWERTSSRELGPSLGRTSLRAYISRSV
jgi:hypothetical protein